MNNRQKISSKEIKATFKVIKKQDTVVTKLPPTLTAPSLNNSYIEQPKTVIKTITSAQTSMLNG